MRIGIEINNWFIIKWLNNSNNTNKRICCIDDTAVAVICGI